MTIEKIEGCIGRGTCVKTCPTDFICQDPELDIIIYHRIETILSSATPISCARTNVEIQNR